MSERNNFLTGISICFLFTNVSGEVNPAAKYNVLRIENEIKLTVPEGSDSLVWKYLLEKFTIQQNIFVDTTFHYTAEVSEEIFVDEYFDDENFTLLENRNSVRYRARYLYADSSFQSIES